MNKGETQNQLHGGPRIYETDHWYHYQDGIMRNGLTVATWALTNAHSGDGGFVCVPGSHKTNFLKKFPNDVRKFERAVDYVIQPELLTGDVLIFTEALIHGTARGAPTMNAERCSTNTARHTPPGARFPMI